MQKTLTGLTAWKRYAGIFQVQRRSALSLGSTALLGMSLAATGCGDASQAGSPANQSAPEALSASTGRAGAVLFRDGSDQELEQARMISLRMIQPQLDRAGLRGSDLEASRAEVDELAMAHTRFQQLHQGVPVFGGEAIVHLRKDGSLFAITDALIPNLHVDVRPVLSREDAIEMALDSYSCPDCLTAPPQADMWVMRHDEQDRLVYRVRLDREDGTDETAMPVIFIDARTGDTVWQYDNLQTGSGPSLYSGTVSINTFKQSTTYYMEDMTRKLGTFDNRNTTSSTYRFTDSDDVWDSTSQRAGVDAAYGAAKVYDFYLNVFGRKGIDGSGGPGYYTSIDGTTKLISSKVHYSSKYNNAFWNGSYMTYGDGDGTTFTPLVTIDIAGHEMTHGVTERTAALTYSGESGALNESMSDVLGSMVERYARGETTNTWMIGEEAYTPSTSGDALRYFYNTHLGDQPDHVSEKYTGSSDNGGVHTNSGIPNFVYYLLAHGGTHHLGGSMSGIGADKAQAIWYKALVSFMTSTTNFDAARTATLNAASALYGAGSAEYNAVSTAWALCGVGSSSGGSGGGTTTGSEAVKNGGFESSSDPWVLSGQAYWTGTGSYPHSGTGYLYLGYYNSASGTAYQQVAIPSGSGGKLTFWLNTVSSETTTTTQYDKLYVELFDASGNFVKYLATYSNLDKAAAGSYTQKGAFDLSAYAGQTVFIQFEAKTDSASTTTFRIDDVSIK